MEGDSSALLLAVVIWLQQCANLDRKISAVDTSGTEQPKSFECEREITGCL